MLIVGVKMFVFHWFVPVQVFVALGQMQPDPGAHQRGRHTLPAVATRSTGPLKLARWDHGATEAAELRVDGRDLIGRDAGAPSERHVLLRVRHSGKAGRRFVGADQVVLLHGHDGRQRIADDDNAQAVGKRRAGDVVAGGGLRGGCRRNRRQKEGECGVSHVQSPVGASRAPRKTRKQRQEESRG